jgi:hypothetical protein
VTNQNQKMTLGDLFNIYQLPVLFIDDDIDYANELYKEAQRHHFELKHVRSLEEGKEFLSTEQGQSIRGVILDIICMKEKSQEVPDNTFIITASRYFTKIFPHLPVVALTGETEEYRTMGHLFKDDMVVFSKGSDEEKMFKHLRDKAFDYEKMKIRSNYHDIFEIIDRYFDKKVEEMLVACLRDMNSDDPKIKTGTLGNLRKLQESFYVALNKKNKNMVPREMIFNNNNELNVNNEKIIRHLKGNVDETKHETTPSFIKHGSYIDRLVYFVYKGCSGELHISPQKTSRYTVQSLVNAFLDMLIWLNSIKENKS